MMNPTGVNGLKVYGKVWCGDTARARRLLERNGVSYEWCDIERDDEGRAYVRECNRGKECVPTILFPDGSILVEPSDSVLATKLDSLGKDGQGGPTTAS